MLLATLVAVWTAQTSPPWMTGESRPEDLRVTLVTFSPGDTLTEWWGHTALVVEDTRLHHGRLYNYGMFGFSSGFVHKFVQGRLEFWVEDATVMGTFQLYRQLNRDVRLQELELRPEEALSIGRALATNVLPENRMYLYHHYRDNCSTRPRDMVDRAVGGQLLSATQGPARMSLRRHTRRYSQVNPAMSLVLDYLQNDELDGPLTQAGEAFLPDELEAQVQALVVKRSDGSSSPAVRRQWNWYVAKRDKVPAEPPNWLFQVLVLGCALGALGMLLVRWWASGGKLARVLFGLFNVGVGLVWGGFGVFLFVAAVATDHTVAHRNENLLFIGPLAFALFPLGVMLAFGSRRAAGWLRPTWTALAMLSVLGVAVKALPAFDQDNWNIIALALPVNVLLAFALWLRVRRWAEPVARPGSVAR